MKTYKLFIFILLILFNCVNALEKDRIITFLQEYNADAGELERLPFAIERGYVDVAEFLVLRGEPIKQYTIILSRTQDKAPDVYLKHPLLMAIKNNYISLALKIIELDGNSKHTTEHKLMSFYTTNNGWAKYEIEKKHALHAAIENPNGFPIIEALIFSGVDVNMSYFYRKTLSEILYFTPLVLCMETQQLDVAQFFLDNNAAVDMLENRNAGKSPLYTAVENNYIEGVNLLLSYGADPLRKPSKKQLNPLELAMQKGYWDIVDLLSSATVNNNK